MKKVNLIKIKANYLSEIFQSLDIKFSYVNKKMEQVSAPAKCRDFLGDCIFSRKIKKQIYIYGFKYNFMETPFDDCRFSLTFPDEQSYNNFIANIGWLHEKEKQAGVKLSKIFLTDEKSTLIIEGSNHWISAIWKLSLYTFYLKVISYKTVNYVLYPENEYIEKLTPEIENKFLSKVKSRRVEKYTTDSTVTIHNDYGFYSMISRGKVANPVNTKFVMGDVS